MLRSQVETLEQFIERLKAQIELIKKDGIPQALNNRLNKTEIIDIFNFAIRELEKKLTAASGKDESEAVWSFQRKDFIKNKRMFWWDEYDTPRSISILKPNQQSPEFQLFVNVKSKKANAWKGSFSKFQGNFKKGKEAYRIDHIDSVELNVELLNKWAYGSKELNDYKEGIQKEIDITQSLSSKYVIKNQYGGLYKDSKGHMRHRIYSPKAYINLIDIISKKPFPLNQHQLLDLQEKLLLALQYLHQNGIAHGDIKIDNIVLDKDNNPKFIDLGSANIEDKAEQVKDIKALGHVFLKLECTLHNLSFSKDYVEIDAYTKRHPVLSKMLLNKENLTIDKIIDIFNENRHPTNKLT